MSFESRFIRPDHFHISHNVTDVILVFSGFVLSLCEFLRDFVNVQLKSNVVLIPGASNVNSIIRLSQTLHEILVSKASLSRGIDAISDQSFEIKFGLIQLLTSVL